MWMIADIIFLLHVDLETQVRLPAGTGGIFSLQQSNAVFDMEFWTTMM